LFIIFINYLLKIKTNSSSEILSLSDDTAILLSESTVDILYVEANKLLNTIYTWFCKNKLKLNLIKSKYICFEQQASNSLLRNNLIVHSLKCNYNLSSTCNSKCIVPHSKDI